MQGMLTVHDYAMSTTVENSCNIETEKVAKCSKTHTLKPYLL